MYVVCLLAVWCSSMIVVKDVTIHARLSAREQAIVDDSKNRSTAWGPFRLIHGTSYEHGSINIPGIQVHVPSHIP